jgi:hypothetical protein
MPNKMRKVYRGWYAWLMRLAHYRWIRVAIAVAIIGIVTGIDGAIGAWRSAIPPAVRDAREGDWS